MRWITSAKSEVQAGVRRKVSVANYELRIIDILPALKDGDSYR